MFNQTIALAIVFMLASLPSTASEIYTYIPEKAEEHMSILMEETSETLPEFRLKPYFGALVEHETCITLHRAGCWSPRQQYRTKWPNGYNREQGAGLGMLTRAWRKDGRLRFDTLRNLKRVYPEQLKDLTWDNILDRPDLQIKAILLLWRSNYIKFPESMSVIDRMAMSDSAYNGGMKYLYRERKACKIRYGCSPDIWFDNVEKENARGNKILYGKRTAWDINRHHVRDVMLTRMGKYIQLWYEKENSK